jgi:hypothetical protein
MTTSGPGGYTLPTEEQIMKIHRASALSARAWGALLMLATPWVATPAAAQAPAPTKSFEPSTIGPGSVSTMTLTLTNPDAVVPASGVSITDALPPGMRIATPAHASTDCVNAVLSAPEGQATVALSGGRLGTQSSCEITVDVDTTAPGSFVNTTGDLTSSAGNGGSASATLTVDTGRPGFSMRFSPSTVGLGGTSTALYTIDNSLNPNPIQGIQFTHVFPSGMFVASPTRASHDCGVTTRVTAASGSGSISVSIGAFAAGATCTLAVDVTSSVAGRHINETGLLSYFGGSAGKATAVLEVSVLPLNLTALFSGDPVPPGRPLSVQYTIDNFGRGTAQALAFTHDLESILSGLAAQNTPMMDPCGQGSALTGTGQLSLTGGELAPGGRCTFSVDVLVPPATTPGSYESQTSSITADVDGRPVVGSRGIDSFTVELVPVLEKSMTPDPVGAGQLVDVEFRLLSGSEALPTTDIAFIDNLTRFAPGWTIESLPPDGFCGPAAIARDVVVAFEESGLQIQGARLDAAGSCQFTVQLRSTPPGGTFINVTDPVTAVVDGRDVTGRAATAEISVLAAPRVTKSFASSPVTPGGQVELRFTIHHGAEAVGDAEDIALIDDLDAMLSGSAAVGLPAVDVCGVGSALEGTSPVTLTGGRLAPGEECDFSVLVQIPEDAPTGRYANTTGDLTARVDGLDVSSPPAEATLDVGFVSWSKAFIDGPAVPSVVTSLQFEIVNTDPRAPSKASHSPTTCGRWSRGSKRSTCQRTTSAVWDPPWTGRARSSCRADVSIPKARACSTSCSASPTPPKRASTRTSRASSSSKSRARVGGRRSRRPPIASR